MGTQEATICRLVTRNRSYDAYFWFLIFWVAFCGKMGAATTCTPSDLGPPKPTEKLADCVNLLGQPLSRNNVFEIFSPPPLVYIFTAHKFINAHEDQ